MPLGSERRGRYASVAGGRHSRRAGRHPQPSIALSPERGRRCCEFSEKADFLAEMCHEIRSPLGSLVLSSFRLADTARLPAAVRTDADRVRIASERLIRLLDDMLLYHRLNTRALPLSMERFDLPFLLHELVVLLTPKAEVASVRLHLVTADDAPSMVVGDKGKLSQIVTNLIENAIAHAGCRNIVVALSADELDRFCITIEDDGLGSCSESPPMKPGAVDSATRAWNLVGGVGLGLSICDTLVRLLEGEMTFSARAGNGLRVRVILPGHPDLVRGTCP